MSKNKDLVVKDNGLNAYTFYKSSIQLKILSKIIVDIRKNPELENYKFYIKDIFDDFGGSKENYTYLKKVCKQMNQMIDIPQERGFQLEVLFYSVGTKEDGYITFKVNPELKPYLLKLNTEFTKYYLSNISKLKSYYSIRIYELLKQYQNKKDLSGWWKVTIERLREILKIDKDKYKLYGHFKQKVILQAQKELKKYTDIKFTFEEEKTGRKVTKIIFFIEPNINKIQPKENEIVEHKEELNIKNKELYKLLKNDLKLDNIFINEILEKYEEKRIFNNAKHTLKEFKNGKIKSSIGGYFREALKADYANQKTITDIKKDIEKQRKEERLKEELKEKKLEQLKNEFEEYKKELINEFVEDNLGKSFEVYNELKNNNTNKFIKYEKLEKKELLNFVKTNKSLASSNYRIEILNKYIKDKKDFISFCKDKNISIIKTENDYKIA